MKLKHNIPLGTKVSARGEIFIVSDYVDVHLCDGVCSMDHDHYEVPHIHVTQEIRTCIPLSEIEYVFVDNVGKPLPAELREYIIR